MAEAENLFAEAMGDEKVIRINKQAKLQKFAVDISLRDEIQGYVIFGQKTRKLFEPNAGFGYGSMFELGDNEYDPIEALV